MERENDAQLIQDTLAGDDEAFDVLVRKYQKNVHALAWRKIRDFHYAEEVTQDTFLRAYQNLSTLKNPHQFAGWLYVIANRLCINWLQKQKSAIQSLEDTPMEEIEDASYTHYESEQRKTAASEHRLELAKKLLAKLPESEQTVATLYYLGEMTTKEIGRFLGVSVNTITSRLQRARKRLQDDQEHLIKEVLGGRQIPARLSESIKRQIADMKPTPSPAGKPLLPWSAFGTAVVVIVLMLGVSSRYLNRFQRPYNFEARSEPTIEIIEAPVVFDVDSKPDVRNQVGRAVSSDKSTGASLQTFKNASTSNAQDNSAKFSNAQWIQGNAPPGGHVRNIFADPAGTLYAVSPTGLYRLAVGATAWARINANIPIDKSFMPMAAHEGTLYIVSVDAIFTSDDRGETWNSIGTRPKGYAVGLIIPDVSQAPMTMYLALQDKGIFRSTDGGIKWDPLTEGLRNEKISAIATVKEIVFVGTNRGLYRLDSDIWKKLPVGASQSVYSLAVFNNNVYVATGPDLPHLDSDIWKKLPVGASQSVYSLAVFNNNLHTETGPDLLGFTPIEVGQAVPKSELHSVRVFHSADLGASWTEIMHIDKPDPKADASGITVLAAGETILALGATQSLSTDGGHTWTEFKVDTNMQMISSLPVVAANEATFYKAGTFGIHRTTDSGKSWHLFMDGIVGTRTNNLVVFNNRLYAHTGYEVYQSTDEGGTWKKLSIAGEFATEETTSEPLKQDRLRVYTSFDSQLMVDGNVLYFVSPERHILRIYRLSVDGNMLIPVQNFSTYDHESLSHLPEKEVKIKAIVVSNNVLYAEYGQRLFKWKLGDPKWMDTGLINTDKQPNADIKNGFKVAVSEATVYVGKRDGQLFQSLDSGKNWKDITLSLPLRFTHFNDILFVGSTIYVATDAGVLVSQTGEHWHVITDNLGERSIINRFAIDGITVYGAGDAGIYRLDNLGKWKQISSEVLGEVISLAVINNRLYTAINERGIFHISLGEE
ncbi:MAG: sigma-70 family RNA polymerase sigma factor [Candidatus Poribacteria bacterium]|nr:sigma-70 family RNA polymerase sigma factor [Candidatus Poribacteria bacterium]